MAIEEVNQWQLLYIAETRDKLGLFLAWDGNFWVACDNSTGDAWVEEFDEKQDAIDYLNGDNTYM